ncbi:MAG: L,D-transpeptidase [Anaerolineales bacterium]|nr:L,D-transpeptidase [Anaerolineales bacterium]
MSTPVISSRGKAAILLLLAIMVCVFVVAAARKTDAVFASGLENLSTPTHAPFYGMMELAKPSYSSTPTIEPPTQIAPAPVELTATVDSIANAEVIPDTPVPDYASQGVPESSDGNPYSGNKYVLVDISEQHMYVYEGDALVYSFVSSTGMNNATRVGSFSVLDKIPNAYGATWDLWMPNWLGIYWSGSLENGIHALPILSNGTQLWAGYLGTPISFGCVVLGVEESQLLYDWVDVGTPVDIQW